MAVGKSQNLTRVAGGLAVALAAGLFLLFWALRARYENRLRQQIWPDHAPGITVVSNSPPGQARTVLLLGDSRMAQWGLPQLAHWRVVNAGTGGLTTGQIRLRVPALLEQFHPDVVVLQAGINDLKFLGLEPEMASQVVPLVSSNIAAMVNESAQRHCHVILLTIWPAGPLSLARRLVWSGAVAPAIDQLNGQLQMLASSEKGIHVVNLFKAAGLKPGPEFYRDTLHLNSAAYPLLTLSLQKELDNSQPHAGVAGQKEVSH